MTSLKMTSLEMMRWRTDREADPTVVPVRRLLVSLFLNPIAAQVDFPHPLNPHRKIWHLDLHTLRMVRGVNNWRPKDVYSKGKKRLAWVD